MRALIGEAPEERRKDESSGGGLPIDLANAARRHRMIWLPPTLHRGFGMICNRRPWPSGNRRLHPDVYASLRLTTMLSFTATGSRARRLDLRRQRALWVCRCAAASALL